MVLGKAKIKNVSSIIPAYAVNLGGRTITTFRAMKKKDAIRGAKAFTARFNKSRIFRKQILTRGY